MADGQAPAMAAPFPNPPPYAKYFTKDNLDQLRDIRRGQPSDDTAALPDDLQYLIPPEPPTDGKYRSFGVNHDLDQPDLSLTSAGIVQLYPSTPRSTDPTTKLIALTRAILLNYLELLGILSLDAEQTGPKIEELQTLFYNVHDLINQYRPHQARESLIVLMEEQLASAKGEIAAVNAAREKLGGLLQSVAARGAGVKVELDAAAATVRSNRDGDVGEDDTRVESGKGYDADAKGVALQRRQWYTLDAEFG